MRCPPDCFDIANATATESEGLPEASSQSETPLAALCCLVASLAFHCQALHPDHSHEPVALLRAEIRPQQGFLASNLGQTADGFLSLEIPRTAVVEGTDSCLVLVAVLASAFPRPDRDWLAGPLKKACGFHSAKGRATRLPAVPPWLDGYHCHSLSQSCQHCRLLRTEKAWYEAREARSGCQAAQLLDAAYGSAPTRQAVPWQPLTHFDEWGSQRSAIPDCLGMPAAGRHGSPAGSLGDPHHSNSSVQELVVVMEDAAGAWNREAEEVQSKLAILRQAVVHQGA